MNKEILPLFNFFVDAYKVDDSEKVFFASDFHYDHNRDFIWGVRGYKNVTEMNETQVKNWNSVITNNDTVFYLGDLKFGRDISCENVLRRLNFKRIFLMPGNHFSGFREIADKMIGHCGYILDGHKEIQPIPNYFEIWYKKQFIVLSHYPIGSWNKIRKGAYNLYGHCHGTYKNNVGKQIEIGFDNFPIPKSFEEIQKIMNSKKIEDVDGTHSTSNNFFR